MRKFIAGVVVAAIAAATVVYFVGADDIGDALEAAKDTVQDALNGSSDDGSSDDGSSDDGSSGGDPVDGPGTPDVRPADRTLVWEISELHGAGGRFSSLAIDSNDNVHIAHAGYSGSSSVLYYTTNASGAWAHQVVETTGIAESISIAIDSNDGIHISYYATDGDYDLKYAYKATASSTWKRTTIDTAGTVGQYNAIAVDDTNNRVHIVYGDLDSGSLDHATNTIGETSGWQMETIDGDTTGQVAASVVVDDYGRLHVAYRAQTSTLKYVKGSFGSWSTPSTIDSGGAISDTSIVLDSAGYAHIAYFRGGLDVIKYATNAEDYWIAEEIEESYAGSRGKHTSIAIDSNDNIYIAYYKENSSASALKIVRSVEGTWRSQTIEERSDDDGTGKYTSIGIDSLGRVHISYYESNGSDLKYAVAE